MQIETFYAIGAYFIVMLGIGVFSYRQANSSAEDYLLGGRSLSPKVAALSAGASDMSGWMLMGLPGAVYLSGLSANWIAVGLVVGAWLNYRLVAPRLRSFTETANNAITIPDYFSNRFADDKHLLRLLTSIIIVIFFTLYTSSGLVAGGKLFESAFGLEYQLGLWLTAGVVVSYTLLGGFMAVSLTDFVQGCIIMIALVLMPVVLFIQLNDANALSQLQSNHLLDIWVNASTQEALSGIGIVSLLAWGLGYFGQPHIIVRFMAVKTVADMVPTRRIGMSWMIISLAGTVTMGLLGSVYIAENQLTLQDPETVFIYLSQTLFSPLVAGFLLAAILAAIMSTISSQLLVTSSSLSRDFYQTILNTEASETQVVFISRACVVLVAVIATLMASDQNSSILSLVSNAWAGFGAAFGPVVLFSLFWRHTTLMAAIGGMLTGAITVILWISLPFTIDGQSLSAWLYEIVPGFIVASVTIWLIGHAQKETHTASKTMFDSCEQAFQS